MEPRKPPHEKIKLSEVNSHLTCFLCKGYFIDATTIVECLHSFCRSCIIKYLHLNSFCPICGIMVNTVKPNIKPDKTLQDIVYKLVPGLFASEMTRRRAFYKEHPKEALYEISPEARGLCTERIIFSPQDAISLSIEYTSDDKPDWNRNQPVSGDSDVQLRRYLQCPAMLRVEHLKKFICNKYSVDSSLYHVDILHKRVPLPDHYTLMDIAYIYSWKRNEPLKFFFRITDINLVCERFDYFEPSAPAEAAEPVEVPTLRVSARAAKQAAAKQASATPLPSDGQDKVICDSDKVRAEEPARRTKKSSEKHAPKTKPGAVDINGDAKSQVKVPNSKCANSETRKGESLNQIVEVSTVKNTDAPKPEGGIKKLEKVIIKDLKILPNKTPVKNSRFPLKMPGSAKKINDSAIKIDKILSPARTEKPFSQSDKLFDELVVKSEVKTLPSKSQISNSQTRLSKHMVKADVANSTKELAIGEKLKCEIPKIHTTELSTVPVLAIATPLAPKLTSLKSVKSDVSKSVKHDVPKSVKHDVPKSVKADVSKSIKSDVVKSVKSDVSKSLKADGPKSGKTDVSKSVKSDAPKPINSDVSTSVKSDVPKSPLKPTNISTPPPVTPITREPSKMSPVSEPSTPKSPTTPRSPGSLKIDESPLSDVDIEKNQFFKSIQLTAKTTPSPPRPTQPQAPPPLPLATPLPQKRKYVRKEKPTKRIKLSQPPKIKNILPKSDEVCPANTSVQDPKQQSTQLQTLFDNCKINIPSSLSITLTVSPKGEDGASYESKPTTIKPVQNYIEILKLPEEGKVEGKTASSSTSKSDVAKRQQHTFQTMFEEAIKRNESLKSHVFLPTAPTENVKKSPVPKPTLKPKKNQSNALDLSKTSPKSEAPTNKRNILEIAHQLSKKSKMGTETVLNGPTARPMVGVSPPKHIIVNNTFSGGSLSIREKSKSPAQSPIKPPVTPPIKSPVKSPLKSPGEKLPIPRLPISKAPTLKLGPANIRNGGQYKFNPNLTKILPKKPAPVCKPPPSPIPVEKAAEPALVNGMTPNQILEKYNITSLAQLNANLNQAQIAYQQAVYMSHQIELQRLQQQNTQKAWLSNPNILAQFENYVQNLKSQQQFCANANNN